MGAPRRASHQHSRGRVPGRRRGPRLGRGEGLADGQEAEGNGGGGSGGSEVSWTSSQHRKLKCIQGDTEEFAKPPVDSDLGCSVILPGQ